jgi:hypothetical protein
MPLLSNLFPGNNFDRHPQKPEDVVEFLNKPEIREQIENKQRGGDWRDWAWIFGGLFGSAAGGYGLYRLYKWLKDKRTSLPPSAVSPPISYQREVSSTPSVTGSMEDARRLFPRLFGAEPAIPQERVRVESLAPDINIIESMPEIKPVSIKMLINIDRLPDDASKEQLIRDFITGVEEKVNQDAQFFEGYRLNLRRYGWLTREPEFKIEFREPLFPDATPYKVFFLHALSDYVIKETLNAYDIGRNEIGHNAAMYLIETFTRLKTSLPAEYFDVFLKVERGLVRRFFEIRQNQHPPSPVFVVKNGEIMIENGLNNFVKPNKDQLSYLARIIEEELSRRSKAIKKLEYKLRSETENILYPDVPEYEKSELLREVRKALTTTQRAYLRFIPRNSDFKEGLLSETDYSKFLAKSMAEVQDSNFDLIFHLSDKKNLLNPDRRVIDFITREVAWEIRPAMLTAYIDRLEGERKIISFDFKTLVFGSPRNIPNFRELIIPRMQNTTFVEDHPLYRDIMTLLRGTRGIRRAR